MTDGSNKFIRNSTAEFLIFTGQAGEQSIEACYEGKTIWLTQKLMGEDYFERLLEDIRERRFSRSLGNLFHLFSYKVDRCTCFMNDGESPILVSEQKDGSRDILHEVYRKRAVGWGEATNPNIFNRF
ncbi:MAG: hypothetical protein WAT53_00635, partial [Nitrosomonas sp.]